MSGRLFIVRIRHPAIRYGNLVSRSQPEAWPRRISLMGITIKRSLTNGNNSCYISRNEQICEFFIPQLPPLSGRQGR